MNDMALEDDGRCMKFPRAPSVSSEGIIWTLQTHLKHLLKSYSTGPRDCKTSAASRLKRTCIHSQPTPNPPKGTMPYELRSVLAHSLKQSAPWKTIFLYQKGFVHFLVVGGGYTV